MGGEWGDYMLNVFSCPKYKKDFLVIVAQSLTSPHNNTAMRIHKCVCEASIHCKIQPFEE